MTCSRAQEHLRAASAAVHPSTAADLSVRVVGAGPDLLLVHGLSANRSEWDAVATALAGRFRLILPDLAGRGESPAAPGMRFGLEREADRLAVLYDELALHEPVVAGHSHGAALAVALAARRSCAGLLLINPVTPWTRRPPVLSALGRGWIRRLLIPAVRHYRRSLTRYILTRRVYADPARATDATVHRYAGSLDGQARIDAILRVLADWRPGELAAYDCRSAVPVRLVTGRRDRRAPPREVERWARSLGGTCEVLEHCAHGVPEEAPDRVVEMILELDRVRSAGRTEGR